MPSYEKEIQRFEGLNTQVVGVSVDSVPSHDAWQKSLGGISFPLCSDFYPHGEVTDKYGILRAEGISERALFVVDKEGIIRFIDVHPIEKQPNNEEIFAVLEKLQ
ncbi:alkyl hydroperoxide reductase [Desulfuribacillus alkaliarsenatis]|uniref:Alkyl hydroperoxide reductase n=1 Tax=Desulfuribacillus alkaliarsenatis TaxID=766136 RepID=A0A1E5G515_9FIRM|nr:alkyl hydroperoxide reductase [Desulfuribacillus alkaliarsenatis]